MKVTALSLGALASGSLANANQSQKRPNIIWIMPDDLGYGDLGCYGCKDFATPHLDRLAAEGVKCDSFYSAAPTCTSSRACILSGRYPEAIGMTQVLMGHGGISPEVVTLTEVLKKAGYATGLVGKWHLGYDGDSLPNRQGFDEFYGFRGGKIDYYKHTDSAQKIAGSELGKHDFYENDEEIFPEGYSTELFTRRAVKFVEDHKDEPFFLFLTYNAPHYARGGVMQAPEEYIKRFAKGEKPTMRELYAAMVCCMDEGIGELMALLGKNGLDENTIVMFISDNGADPKHGGSNTPLSGGKWSWNEGGVRVPMIARWPGRIPAGSTSNEAIHMIDMFPTMLAASGLPDPQDVPLDGLNVLDALEGKARVPERPLFFGKDTVRKGKWKRMGDKLYNLNRDLQEKENLAGKAPEVFRELQSLHR